MPERLVEFLYASHLIIGEPINKGAAYHDAYTHLCIELVIIDDRTIVHKGER